MKKQLELRIAPELYLKQLVIGGFERVYELGKVFRNEGIDASHNPEFTSLEFYMAFADYRDLVAMTEDLLEKLALELFGATRVLVPQFDIDQRRVTKGAEAGRAADDARALEFDFKGPYPQFDVCEALGVDPDLFGRDAATVKAALLAQTRLISDLQRPIDFAALNNKQLVDKLIELRIEPKCQQPSFIMNHPMLMSPLAKSHAQGRSRGSPHLAERFELFAGGRELVNAYSEQNDPEAQRRGFE